MISLVFGWRLRRNPEDGCVEARCPTCYQHYRASGPTPVTPPPPASRTILIEPARRCRAVPMATRFRSTWLGSSLAALRERGLLERYLSHLPPRYHPVITANIAGTWLPIDVATEHYAACDALGLATAEVLAIGHQVTEWVVGKALHLSVALAHELGVTPWAPLARAQAMWRRYWDGGDVSVLRLGPKEARIEIAGWPCARTSYCRVACRGMLTAIVDPFCTKAYVREDPRACGESTLGYVAAWA